MRLWILAFPLLAMACSSEPSDSSNAQPGSEDAGTEASITEAPDAQADQGGPPPPDSGGTDGGTTVPETSPCDPTADDPPDREGADTNCDGFDGVVGVDVYVHPVDGRDTNLGEPDSPLRSIDAAINVASPRSGKVLLAAGAYALSGLQQTGSYEIHGGYSSFDAKPDKALTVLQAEAPAGVHLEQAASVKLARLTVLGMDGTPSEPSSHALVLDVDATELVQVVVTAGSGAPGVSGIDGSPGSDGATCTAPDAQGASAKQQNAEGSPLGADGSPGLDGADAANSDGILTWDGTALKLTPGLDAASTATPGFGGSGGSGSGTMTFNNKTFQWLAGKGGTGGCAGASGTGGTSGGSSAAIVLMRGALTLRESVLQTGLGGVGGNGGLAGAPGAGQLGFPPECTSTDCTGYPQLSSDCGPTNWSGILFQPVGCAAWGGNGAAGGKGGNGGAGAGGWTIGILRLSDATGLDMDSATVFELGTPGRGGEAGTTRAPGGQQQSTHGL